MLLNLPQYPDTLRITVKASSYSKAVYVSYIPSGTPCHYTTPSFFSFWSQTSTVPTDIQRSIARSCSTPATAGVTELLLTPLLYLMVPILSATYPVAPAPPWVTHPATNRAKCCLTCNNAKTQYTSLQKLAHTARLYMCLIYLVAPLATTLLILKYKILATTIPKLEPELHFNLVFQ